MSKEKETEQRILLFEQDGETVKLFKETLVDLGYDVEPVEDGTTGMAGLETNPPELVIADVDFPYLHVFNIFERITSNNLNIPVIITGNSSEENILRAFRKGASDYLVKPLDNAVLKERITALFAQRRKKSFEAGKDNIQRLLENMERDNDELNNLLKISSSFDISGDSKAMLNRLTELAADSMNCEAASIMLINDRENVLEFVVATGEKKLRLETMTIPMGEGIAGWVAVEGEPQIVNDTTKDERFTGKVDDESGFVTRQILAIPLNMDKKIIGILEVINTNDKRILGDEDLRVLTEIGERIATVIETTRIIENQQNFYIQTTNIIVKAIEKKDMYAEGHAWKVAEWCHKIAANLNISEKDKNDLHFGALLHDIGKLEMPSTYFNKRNLSEREMVYIRRHPVQGAKLLEPINLWNPLVPLVLHHHEAFDGSGYPFGRSGDSIPLGSRIINLAESFSVMRSPNTYKKQMTLKDSILEIMRFSGKQFDPKLVQLFISVLEKEQSRI